MRRFNYIGGRQGGSHVLSGYGRDKEEQIKRLIHYERFKLKRPIQVELMRAVRLKDTLINATVTEEDAEEKGIKQKN